MRGPTDRYGSNQLMTSAKRAFKRSSQAIFQLSLFVVLRRRTSALRFVMPFDAMRDKQSTLRQLA